MFERIATKHDLGQSFLDLPTCFYNRTQATEEAYSIPITHHTNGTCTGKLEPSPQVVITVVS